MGRSGALIKVSWSQNEEVHRYGIGRSTFAPTLSLTMPSGRSASRYCPTIHPSSVVVGHVCPTAMTWFMRPSNLRMRKVFPYSQNFLSISMLSWWKDTATTEPPLMR